MRFFAVLASATFLYQLGAAIPVRGRNINGLASREDAFNLYTRYDDSQAVLEARGKKYEPKPEVKFRKGESKHDAANTMERLQLQSSNRKHVETFHEKIVREKMPAGTKSAEVVNLAHGKGSWDPKIHVSAQYKDKHGNLIQTSRHGNPKKYDDTAHLYIGNPDDHNSIDEYNRHAHSKLPEPYKQAVAKSKGAKKSDHTMF